MARHHDAAADQRMAFVRLGSSARFRAELPVAVGDAVPAADPRVLGRDLSGEVAYGGAGDRHYLDATYAHRSDEHDRHAGAADVSLLRRHRAYVSFISALHLYGIIEQIPQVVTLATTAHTKTIRTKAGIFRLHQMHPSFFDGFGWYKGAGSFLIAEPEKALVDSLYLSTRKKKQFGYFPELYFPESFSFQKAKKWVKKISDYKIRVSVERKLENITVEYRKIKKANS